MAEISIGQPFGGDLLTGTDLTAKKKHQPDGYHFESVNAFVCKDCVVAWMCSVADLITHRRHRDWKARVANGESIEDLFEDFDRDEVEWLPEPAVIRTHCSECERVINP